MLLALETATSICSVAFKNQHDEIFEKRSEIHGSHSENLFLFIRELMGEQNFLLSDLEAVLVSEGPGSYTGLRIAASGVKGLLFGKDVTLYGINTLASFAMMAAKKYPDSANIHSIIDARRKHLYHQSYTLNNDQLAANGTVEIRPIEKIEQIILPGEVIIGTGINRLDESLLKKVKWLGKEAVSAVSIIELYGHEEATKFIHQVSPEKFEPRYYTSNQV